MLDASYSESLQFKRQQEITSTRAITFKICAAALRSG